LKENRILAILGDRIFTEKGMKVEFMGREVLFPRGPATLAIKTGAEFIAGFLIMKENGYRMFFREIEKPPFHLSEEEKIKLLTQKGATIIEEVILSHPSQWLNFSNVWEKSITRVRSKNISIISVRSCSTTTANRGIFSFTSIVGRIIPSHS